VPRYKSRTQKRKVHNNKRKTTPETHRSRPKATTSYENKERMQPGKPGSSSICFTCNWIWNQKGSVTKQERDTNRTTREKENQIRL
jgi:hypothetical protein